ncbi:MAG TPA: hypothetical protein VHM69_08415 [Rubrobacter sp.]|nr:hypothetical protein [Rubrobacter sp.]
MSQQTTNRTFDELARGLASGSITRGKALKLMGAALLGGTLASLGIREAAADEACKPLNKKCRKDEQCCSGLCEGGTCAPACQVDSDCPDPGTQCQQAACNNGVCGVKNADDGTPCTDNNACTDPDLCMAGVCEPGPDVCGEG